MVFWCSVLCGASAFFLGVGLGWGILFPLILRYAHWFLPPDVVWLLGLRQYVSLFWYVGVYSGLLMELPLVVFFLAHTGLLLPSQFNQLRPYVLLGCFIIGMFATPPDMFAQILFALPLYALFEIGFCCSRLSQWLGVSQQAIVAVQD